MKNKEEFFNISLRKWPAMVVVGQSVTKEQAMEILIRTDDFGFSTNDQDFKEQVRKLIYATPEDTYQTFVKKYGLLDLEYLHNERICSCWIGGPKGWCSWSGHIGCNNYNIGKWPSIEEVYNEWVLIAQTFPYLDLTCQLLDGETSEENSQAVVEFIVKDGTVEMRIPDYTMETAPPEAEHFMQMFSNPYFERGCTLEMFKKALQLTEERVNQKQLNDGKL